MTLDLSKFEGHTEGPWQYEPGGGHAQNRIIGSESIQVSGWPKRINGVSNAGYSDRVCENLGDPLFPGPSANIALIEAAPELLAKLREAVSIMESTREEMKHLYECSKCMHDQVPLARLKRFLADVTTGGQP